MLRGLVVLSCASVMVLRVSAQEDAAPRPRLRAKLEAMTREPAVARAHWGVSVERMDGSPVVRINAGQFFQPASNAKLFTTAAVMALLPVEERLTTNVVASGVFGEGGVSTGDLRIVGVGDANLSGRPVPYVAPVAGQVVVPRDELRYVNELADAVKSAGITRVMGDVVGDDSLFPWEPYPSDWAIDDTPWYYGAPVSGLMVADGAVTLTVSAAVDSVALRPHPSADEAGERMGRPGSPRDGRAAGFSTSRVSFPADPKLVERSGRNDDSLAGRAGFMGRTVIRSGPSLVAGFDPALPYYTADMQAVVGPAGSGTALDIQRTVGSRVVHVYGRMAADAKPYVQGMSIDDPAEYTAMALKAALEARGMVVSGTARAKHVPGFEASFTKAVMEPFHLPAQAGTGPLAKDTAMQSCVLLKGGRTRVDNEATECVLARHTGPTLYDDIVITNKVSQNQHAELLLRQLGFYVAGAATTAQGTRVVRSFLTTKAGIDAKDFVFYDGSGLSGHDLVTPRAATKLLRYAAGQTWGARWRASLPVGGVDGSLRSRFSGPLLGKVFAKTGTLGEARALSGYLVCRSGRTVVFSVMVSAHTPAGSEEEKVMDRMVEAIAEAE